MPGRADRRRRGLVLVGVVAAMLVAGCAGSSEPDSEAGGAAPQAAPEAAESGGSARDSGVQPGGAGGQPGQLPAATERQIVRSASIELVVADLAGATERVRALGERYGGFVSDETAMAERSSLTLRVDSSRIDAALTDIASLGEVQVRRQRAEDVTEEVVDIETRLANQRASVARVRALLDRAVTLEEIVSLESELTDRQTELESLERRSAALSGQVELATIEVDLEQPDAAAAGDEAGFGTGLSAGWRALLAFGTVALTVIGAVLPFVAVLAVPAVGLAGWLRYRKRRAAPTGQ